MNSISRVLQSDTVEVSKSKRQVRAIWSNVKPDHYRTVFDPYGCDTRTYEKNRLILYDHGHGTRGMRPVGESVGPITIEKVNGIDSIVGTTRFYGGPKDDPDPFADELFRDYAAGRVKGWSIHALPTVESPPTKTEVRAIPELADVTTIYRQWVLLEVSAVELPGNPDALTLAIERSGLEIPPPDPFGGLSDDEKQAVLRQIEHHNRYLAKSRRRFLREFQRMLEELRG